jgi:lipopolysaccharide transport system ATP-binding protein
MRAAIEVSNVTKAFRRYRPDRPHTFQEVLAQGLRGIRSTERFWALRDVSFTVAPGRAVGIIGANGSGKSTLLRLVGGVGTVDAGSVTVAGRIGALLDLSSGFHPDLTGRENAIINGVLNGLTRREVLGRLDDIVSFAEVEQFLDNPMRTYSSGMQMRLAFSTAVHTNPDVLLTDEVLSVGDAGFQRKCLARIAQFKANGCSILLASHEPAIVETLCDEALWLHAGIMMAHGPVSEVIREYETYLGQSMELARAWDATTAIPLAARPVPAPKDEYAGSIPDATSEVSRDPAIASVSLTSVDGRPVDEIQSGQPLRIAIIFSVADQMPVPLFRVRIVREDGLVCYDVGMDASRINPPPISGRVQVTLVLDRLDLNTGRYRFDVWAQARENRPDHEQSASACSLTVIGDGVRDAVLNIPHRWEFQDCRSDASRTTRA